MGFSVPHRPRASHRDLSARKPSARAGLRGAVTLILTVLLIAGCATKPAHQSSKPALPTSKKTARVAPLATRPEAWDQVPFQDQQPQRPRERLIVVTPPGGPELPRLYNAQYSADGKWLAFGVQDESGPSAVVAIKLETFELQTRAYVGERGLAFAPEGATLAYISRHHHLALWELGGAESTLTVPGGSAPSMPTFSPDGRRLAVLQEQGSASAVTVWDMQDKMLLRTVTVPEDTSSLSFSQDGELLAILSAQKASVYDVTEGRPLGDVGTQPLGAVSFSTDGQKLYATQKDGVKAYSLPDLQPTAMTRLSIPYETALSRKPDQLQCLDDHLLRVQSQADTVLIDPFTSRFLLGVNNSLASALSPTGDTLWTLDRDHRMHTFHPEGRTESVSPPVGLSRPMESPNSGRYGYSYGRSFEVRSPVTGARVASFLPLALDRNLTLQWLAWTGDNQWAGSADYKQFAGLLWRGEGEPPKQEPQAVAAAFRCPSGVKSEVGLVSTYARSVKIAASDREAAAKLVDAVLKEPGVWSQMCSLVHNKPPRELPLFGFRRDWSSTRVSEQNAQTLRDNRNPVLDVIAERLYQLSLQISRPEFKLAPRAEELEIYLMAVMDLNGVEVLPQLLNLEQSLHQRANYTDQNSSWGHGAYSPHVQVLSAITSILAAERWEAARSLGLSVDDYSPTTRRRIVTMARNLLNQTPPDKFQGAAGMSGSTYGY